MEIKTVKDAIREIDSIKEILKQVDDPKYVEGGKFVISNDHRVCLQNLLLDTIRSIESAQLK